MIWLVEKKIIVLHVRHAVWCNFLTQFAKGRREIFIFEVLTTTPARSSKYLIFCRCMKTIPARLSKVHAAYFVQRVLYMEWWQAINLTQSSILMWRFRCCSRRSSLNFLLRRLLHDYFSSFNQSNHWFVALSLPLPMPMPFSFLKFPKLPI